MLFNMTNATNIRQKTFCINLLGLGGFWSLIDSPNRCACHSSVDQSISSLDVLWGLVPVTFTLNVLLVVCVSSLRITCPYHDSRFCVGTDLIGITFAFRYSSVLKWDPTKCTLYIPRCPPKRFTKRFTSTLPLQTVFTSPIRIPN